MSVQTNGEHTAGRPPAGGGEGERLYELFGVTGGQARGRNGWMRPRTVDALVRPPLRDERATVRCSVQSARAGGTEPLVLELAGADMLAFGEMLVRKARLAMALDAGTDVRSGADDGRARRSDLALRACAPFADGALADDVVRRLAIEAHLALSRLRALLAVGEAVDFLCQPDVFGPDYEELLRFDEGTLAAVVALCPRADTLGLREGGQRGATRTVLIVADDVDRHGEGCGCGNCDARGRSYGAGLFDLADRRDRSGDEWWRECDPLERIYAPSAEAALSAARLAAGRREWRVAEAGGEG